MCFDTFTCASESEKVFLMAPAVLSTKPIAAASKPCFLCQAECSQQCPHCKLVNYCGSDHFQLHRMESEDYCFPYEASHLEGIGRILRATRAIKSMDLVLVDPGTVVGPNYSSEKVCLECLQPVDGSLVCPECRYPMCSGHCYQQGEKHRQECQILGRCQDWSDELRQINAYAVITPLRTLLLESGQSDGWRRTDQLMDHRQQRMANQGEWDWYQLNVVDFFRDSLQLKCYSEEQIHRSIGLLNVNAVALHFPRKAREGKEESGAVGKGLYPIFAIMSHYCVCNVRYTIHPKTLAMHVRARRAIAAGEELSVQYLSALDGNFKRRRKIRDEWYFDCRCRRCSDPTECGSFVSAIKCARCETGDVLPKESLDYESEWTCGSCGHTAKAESVELLVDGIEAERTDDHACHF